jgi:hypothetical protein
MSSVSFVQEPLVYVNGSPYCLRKEGLSLRNIKVRSVSSFSPRSCCCSVEADPRSFFAYSSDRITLASLLLVLKRSNFGSRRMS